MQVSIVGCDDVAIGKGLTELPSTVERKARVSVVSAGGGNVKDIPALIGGAVLSEEFDSLDTTLITVDRCGMNKTYLQRDLYRAPE